MSFLRHSRRCPRIGAVLCVNGLRRHASLQNPAASVPLPTVGAAPSPSGACWGCGVSTRMAVPTVHQFDGSSPRGWPSRAWQTASFLPQTVREPFKFICSPAYANPSCPTLPCKIKHVEHPFRSYLQCPPKGHWKPRCLAHSLVHSDRWGRKRWPRLW